jgi:hypothetical protein
MQFGHGVGECDDAFKKKRLAGSRSIEIEPQSIDPESYCTKPLCKNIKTHTTASHHDAFDARYQSSLSAEDLQWLTDALHPSCHNVVNMDTFITDYYYHAVKKLLSYDRHGKVYVLISAGMGCTIYAKKITTG